MPGDSGSSERSASEREFSAFVAQHQDRAVRLARRLLGGDLAAAEDVAQEAFLRAYRSLDRFRGESKVSTWFYRILVREASRHRRWRAVRQRFGSDAQEDWADPAPDAATDPLLRDRIGQALEKLSRGQREAFVLVRMEGWSIPEAAELLGRSTGTIKTHLHRASKALRMELTDWVARESGA